MRLHFLVGFRALFIGPTTQVWKKANLTLKLGPTTLFAHLKIILLQCFQFSTISGIQTDPIYAHVRIIYKQEL